jgi:hypothetical protein
MQHIQLCIRAVCVAHNVNVISQSEKADGVACDEENYNCNTSPAISFLLKADLCIILSGKSNTTSELQYYNVYSCMLIRHTRISSIIVEIQLES